MEKEEYEKKLDLIKSRHNDEINALHMEYADSNNPYKIGDIVTDNIGSVKIEKIKYTIALSRIPSCIFYGQELTKKGIPKKNGSKREIWQGNIEEKK